jgi:hypothetical protein
MSGSPTITTKRERTKTIMIKITMTKRAVRNYNEKKGERRRRST